jgi:hypothetical protein
MSFTFGPAPAEVDARGRLGPVGPACWDCSTGGKVWTSLYSDASFDASLSLLLEKMISRVC